MRRERKKGEIKGGREKDGVGGGKRVSCELSRKAVHLVGGGGAPLVIPA